VHKIFSRLPGKFLKPLAPDFKATMHQIRFRLRHCPDPAGGAYIAVLMDLKGALLQRVGEGKGVGGKGRREVDGEGERKGRGNVSK